MNFLFKGWQIIWQPKIRLFVYIPLLINLFVLSIILGISAYYFNSLTLFLSGFVPSWLQWLDFIFWGLYFLIVVFVSIYLFTWLANFIGALFYSYLSAKVQETYYPDTLKTKTDTWQQYFTILPQILGRKMRILCYILPRMIGIFILSLIPGLNLLALVLWFLLGSWSQTFQYLDYPTDNNEYSIPELREFMSANKIESFSFGSILMLLMMLPIINIFIMPAAVAGATMMWCETQKQVKF